MIRVELLYKYPSDELLLGRVAQTCTGYDDKFEVFKDEEDHLIRILEHCYKLKHMSVFEFGGMVFRMRTPIFVARQLMRYRSSSFMERSLRHCKPLPLGDDPFYTEEMRKIYDESLVRYNALIEQGVKKEVARGVLPTFTPTIWLWKINCRSLVHVFDERLAPSAQGLTRDVVKEMKKLFKENFYTLNWIYEKYDDERKGF